MYLAHAFLQAHRKVLTPAALCLRAQASWQIFPLADLALPCGKSTCLTWQLRALQAG